MEWFDGDIIGGIKAHIHVVYDSDAMEKASRETLQEFHNSDDGQALLLSDMDLQMSKEQYVHLLPSDPYGMWLHSHPTSAQMTVATAFMDNFEDFLDHSTSYEGLFEAAAQRTALQMHLDTETIKAHVMSFLALDLSHQINVIKNTRRDVLNESNRIIAAQINRIAAQSPNTSMWIQINEHHLFALIPRDHSALPRLMTPTILRNTAHHLDAKLRELRRQVNSPTPPDATRQGWISQARRWQLLRALNPLLIGFHVIPIFMLLAPETWAPSTPLALYTLVASVAFSRIYLSREILKAYSNYRIGRSEDWVELKRILSEWLKTGEKPKADFHHAEFNSLAVFLRSFVIQLEAITDPEEISKLDAPLGQLQNWATKNAALYGVLRWDLIPETTRIKFIGISYLRQQFQRQISDLFNGYAESLPKNFLLEQQA